MPEDNITLFDQEEAAGAAPAVRETSIPSGYPRYAAPPVSEQPKTAAPQPAFGKAGADWVKQKMAELEAQKIAEAEAAELESVPEPAAEPEPESAAASTVSETAPVITETVQETPSEPAEPEVKEDRGDDESETGTVRNGETPSDAENAGEEAAPVEKKKRRRRTKAEMEAARAAEEARNAEAAAADVAPAEEASGKSDEDESGEDLTGLPTREVMFRVIRELRIPRTNKQTDPTSGRTWNFRTVEEIEKCVKELGVKYGFFIRCVPSLEITSNGWVYTKVELTVIRTDPALDDAMFVGVGYAREEESRPGNWAAQITGSVESYAKKRAYGNLFMIDDSGDDPDTRTPAEAAVTANGGVQGSAPASPIIASGSGKEPFYKGSSAYAQALLAAKTWEGTKEEFHNEILAKCDVLNMEDLLIVEKHLYEGR